MTSTCHLPSPEPKGHVNTAVSCRRRKNFCSISTDAMQTSFRARPALSWLRPSAALTTISKIKWRARSSGSPAPGLPWPSQQRLRGRRKFHHRSGSEDNRCSCGKLSHWVQKTSHLMTRTTLPTACQQVVKLGGLTADLVAARGGRTRDGCDSSALLSARLAFKTLEAANAAHVSHYCATRTGTPAALDCCARLSGQSRTGRLGWPDVARSDRFNGDWNLPA
jgi:hypothetical protein